MKRLLAILAVLASALPSRAILLADGEGRHLSPPPDAARRACWNLEGQWGKYLGTPVSEHWFLTADHVGGYAGDVFFFEGQPYLAVAVEHLPGTDLALWRIRGSFPRWAPLSEGNELGRELFLVGRGTARGEALKNQGWRWGTDDHQMSWGSNQVSHFYKSLVVGPLLAWKFDQNAGPDEGTISNGDSGGGVFVKGADGLWRLAGVIHDIEPGPDGVDRFYSLSGKKEEVFRAAIFDGRGLFLGTPDQLTPLTGTTPLPQVSAAAPVAPHLSQIQQIIERPSNLYPSFPPLQETKIWRRGGRILIGLSVLLATLTALLVRRRGAKRS